MDTPTRQGVAQLVQRRSAGLISSVEFFESLSKLELEADDQGTSWHSCEAGSVSEGGQHDRAGHWPPSPFSFSSPLPQLLTQTQAGALLRGEASEPAASPTAGPKMAPDAAAWMSMPSGRSDEAHAEVCSSAHESMSAAESEPASLAPEVCPSLPELLTGEQATAIVQKLGAEWKGTSFADLAQVSSASLQEATDADSRPLPVAQRSRAPQEVPVASAVSSAHEAFGALSAERVHSRVHSRQSSRDSIGSTSLDISLLPPWSCGSVTPRHATPTYLRDSMLAASDKSSSPHSPHRSLASIGTQQSCDSSFSSFSRRSQRWEHQRAQKREQLRRQCDAKELAECSFRPEVRPQTSHTSGSMGCTGDTPATRLAAPPPSAARQAARRWREEQDENEIRECTFAPDLSQSFSSLHMSVRSLNSSFSDTGSIQRPEDGGIKIRGTSADARHTKGTGNRNSQAFAPVTNPISPQMACARTYTSKNVFSRLSDPHPEWSQELPEDSSCERHEDVLQRAHSRDARYGPQRDGMDQDTFIKFLERQNHFEDQRRDRLDEVNRCNSPTHSPALCTTSRKLVERSRKRLDKDADGLPRRSSVMSSSPRGAGVSRSNRVPERRSSTGGTPGCEPTQPTFRPQINAASSRRIARSCTELSIGDQQRREAHVREMREEMRQLRAAEEQEDDHVPFSPNLCTPPPEVKAQSRLRLLEEPSSYLNRVTQGQLTKKFEREVQLQRQLDQELAECTFAPKVNKGAPVFVQQMAESYRSARELNKQKKSQHSPRPAWQ